MKKSCKLTDWREYPAYDGQFIQRSDDFGLQDFNYTAMCENARLKYAEKMATIAPTPNVYASTPPPMPEQGFNIDQLLIPAALVGVGVIMMSFIRGEKIKCIEPINVQFLRMNQVMVNSLNGKTKLHME